jgi:hypothetical protein
MCHTGNVYSIKEEFVKIGFLKLEIHLFMKLLGGAFR